MSDYHRFLLQDNDIGLEEAPVVLPPILCAQAMYLNRYSIVGVLVNPQEQSIKELIRQMPYIWGLTDAVVGRVIDSRKFQFMFKTEEALNRVLGRGPWSFANWMLVTKRWDATVTEEDLKVVKFWVKIKGIPPHYLSEKMIWSIGRKMAEVEDVEFMDYSNLTDGVWMLVNWNINKPLCFKRNFDFGVGEIFTLSFFYDRLKNFCLRCGMMTHSEKECPLRLDDDANNTRGDYIALDNASGPGIDNERQVFSNAFTGVGMTVGSSNAVSFPIPDISPIDCDKLAETSRYLKAKLDKGKFSLGHKLGTTGSTHQSGRWFHPNSSEFSPMSSTYLSNVGTEGLYHPMEKHSLGNNFENAYKDVTLPMEEIGKDGGTSSGVVFNHSIKVEECESVGSSG